MPPSLWQTISFDNATEFAEHHRLHSLGLQTFFCDLHSPWQKGCVDNIIGRPRRYLPRKTDLESLSVTQVRAHAKRLNDTSRKSLDFQTTAEAFLQISTGALQT